MLAQEARLSQTIGDGRKLTDDRPVIVGFADARAVEKFLRA